MTCPNCGSTRHARCCARCGYVYVRRSIDLEFCSLKCENEQRREDEISDEIERNERPTNSPPNVERFKDGLIRCLLAELYDASQERFAALCKRRCIEVTVHRTVAKPHRPWIDSITYPWERES